MRQGLGLPVMVGLALLAAGQPVAARQAPLSTGEIGEVLRAVALRCPADVSKAIDGAVHDLNAMPERAGAKPLAPADTSTAAFLAAYAGMGLDPASPHDEVALRKVAIDGMIRGFGPTAKYVDFGDETEATGSIGVNLRKQSPDAIILEPIEGGPAEKAGLLAGDRVTSVNGRSIAGLSPQDARDLLRGDMSAPVRLVVARPGQAAPLAIEVWRTNDPLLYQRYNVRSRMVGRVGVVVVVAMNDGTARSVGQQIRALRDLRPAPVGYVLDLRNNSGGLLEQVVALADLFMDKGVVGRVASVGACPPEPVQILSTRRGDETGGAPLIVLVSADTASGAELLASGLAQSGRAKVMGERTFGAGEIKTVFPVAGTKGLVLPTGEFLTRDGSRLQGVGVVPSILAPAVDGAVDAPLDQAVTILQGGDGAVGATGSR